MSLTEQEKTREFPDFSPGDILRISMRIKEGDKERLSRFEGTVISQRGHGASKTFTVYKISQGIGVERIFPLASPTLERIKVLKRGNVRHAKLYYLRGRTGKRAKVKEKRS